MKLHRGSFALACLTSIGSLLSVEGAARAQTSDDEFEAAMRKATPSAAARDPAIPARGGAGRYVGVAFYEGPAAPRGAIPARWRTLKEIPYDAGALQEDINQGRLDPAALVEQLAGPLTLPPGALPVSCGRFAGRVSFTMGVDLSPEYAELAAKGRRNAADPGDVSDRAAIDAKPTRDRLRAFFTAHGFREFSTSGRRAGFFDEKRGMRVEVEDSSASMRRYCLDLTRPIELPTGPLLHFLHAARLGSSDTFVDEKPAPAGKRVTHPFG